MKITNELKEMRLIKIKELSILLNKQYEKLRELRFSDKFRKNKDLQSIKKTKKNIARIWTVLREKMLAESEIKEK